jgi:hypothetical protein
MSTEISNSTGYRAGDTDDIMESGSDYFSADEEERRDRMEVEQIPAPTFGFGAPENLDASQAKFSFGVSKSTDQSQTPGSTVSRTFVSPVNPWRKCGSREQRTLNYRAMRDPLQDRASRRLLQNCANGM